MWKRYRIGELLAWQTIILAIALLFAFVGFKIGERYAPIVKIEWSCANG